MKPEETTEVCCMASFGDWVDMVYLDVFLRNERGGEPRPFEAVGLEDGR